MKNDLERTPPADPRIVGSWKGLAGGDYDLINEYRSDGTIIQHVGKSTSKPFPFRIDGNHIVYTPEQPNGSVVEQRTQYLLSGDILTFVYSAEKTMCFQKMDRAQSGPRD